jgi:heme-degrading monooxygenase HmoA
MHPEFREQEPAATTPQPPYFAVIFTSQRRETDPEGYAAMSRELEARARSQPGFLGIESVRDAAGIGITVSYWSSLEAIRLWRNDPVHRQAQELGQSTWYEGYSLRICRVERAWEFPESTRDSS